MNSSCGVGVCAMAPGGLSAGELGVSMGMTIRVQSVGRGEERVSYTQHAYDWLDLVTKVWQHLF